MKLSNKKKSEKKDKKLPPIVTFKEEDHSVTSADSNFDSDSEEAEERQRRQVV